MTDIIAGLALLVSVASAAFAGLAWWDTRGVKKREAEREALRSLPSAQIHVVNDGDEGPGPQRHLKLIFVPAEDHSVCEYRQVQVRGSGVQHVEVRFDGTAIQGDCDVPLRPHLTINERKQVNLTLHLLAFDATPSTLTFSGVRHDDQRTAITTIVTVPAYRRGNAV